MDQRYPVKFFNNPANLMPLIGEKMFSGTHHIIKNRLWFYPFTTCVWRLPIHGRC